jgi:Fe-S-cluster containining protein
MTHDEGWGELLEELELQRACLEMMNSAWTAEYRARGGRIFCDRGCRACCSLTVNCTLTEAVSLSATLTDTQADAVASYALLLRERSAVVTDLKEYLRMQRRDMGWCPLLNGEGACGAYAVRPLSCRSLLSTRENRWCGVDFAELTSAEKEAYLATLDRSVVAFPLHYAASPQETGGELETRGLALMRERFGCSVYGTMPVLVHLVRVCALAEALADGPTATRELINGSGFGQPFLVEVSSA